MQNHAKMRNNGKIDTGKTLAPRSNTKYAVTCWSTFSIFGTEVYRLVIGITLAARLRKIYKRKYHTEIVIASDQHLFGNLRRRNVPRCSVFNDRRSTDGCDLDAAPWLGFSYSILNVYECISTTSGLLNFSALYILHCKSETRYKLDIMEIFEHNIDTYI